METINRKSFDYLCSFQDETPFIAYLLKLAHHHFKSGVTLENYSGLDWSGLHIRIYESEILKLRAETYNEIFLSSQPENVVPSLREPGRQDELTSILFALARDNPGLKESGLWLKFKDMAMECTLPIFKGSLGENGEVLFHEYTMLEPMTKSKFTDRVKRLRGKKKGR